MKALPTESPEKSLPNQDRWPRHRWWLLIAVVFAAHVALIFAFGDHQAIVPRATGPAPELRLAIGSSELLTLQDPTLFALPHPKGFSAAAWRQSSKIEFPPFRWTEPPRWLALPAEQLGGLLLRLVQTNTFARLEFEALPASQLALPGVLEARPVVRSALRVTGDLAQRRLLSRVELRSWQSADLLTNTVIQILVEPRGNVFSSTLMPPGSGSKDADQWALNFARTARFAPQARPAFTSANPVGQLTRGALIIQWRTEPLPATNAPAPNL
jgi:hypothetical protein